MKDIMVVSEPVKVKMTPKMLAGCFANMDDEGQALFFNELHAEVLEWSKPFCFQMSAIADSPALTEAGRSIMRTFKEYGE